MTRLTTRLFTVAAVLFVSVSLASAGSTYSGKISLTQGEIQNLAKPGSISIVFKGSLKDSMGFRATVTGGGLFRSTSNAIDKATFKGRLTLNVRTSARAGQPSRLVKTNKVVTVRVNGRIVTFPGGKIILKKPVIASQVKKQTISGAGTLSTRA